MSIRYKGKTISGPPGVGVPAGGAAGQILAKASDVDYDTKWVDKPEDGVTMEEVNAAISEAITGAIEEAY